MENTPWEVADVPFGKKKRVFIIRDSRRNTILVAGAHDEDAAKRIVHCVNNHDALVSALREINEARNSEERAQGLANVRNVLRNLAEVK